MRFSMLPRLPAIQFCPVPPSLLRDRTRFLETAGRGTRLLLLAERLQAAHRLDLDVVEIRNQKNRNAFGVVVPII